MRSESPKADWRALKRFSVYLFPLAGTVAYGLYAGLFLDWIPPSRSCLFWLLMFPFYFATLLYTVPINLYTVFMALRARKLWRVDRRLAVHCLAAAIWTFGLSIAFFASYLFGGWLITA